MSPPWMPLYIADYTADTGHLGALESGGYLHLIMHYWRHGGIPKEDASLARIARMTPREWARSRDVVLAFFDSDLRHKRIDQELEKAQVKSERRSDAGSRGGKAKALNNKKMALANATILPEQNPIDALASSSQPQSDKSPLETNAREARAVFAKETAEEFSLRFWPAWPHKVGKPDAAKAFLAARRRGVTCDQILSGVDRYVCAKPPERPWLNPSTFLNQRRWEDEPAPEPIARAGPSRPPEKRNTVFQAAQEMMAELYGGTDGNSERPSDDFSGTTLDLALEPGGRENRPGGVNQATRDDAAASGERGRYEGDVVDLHGPRGRFASG